VESQELHQSKPQHQPENNVNKCPHCLFLVRDDMRTCEVCGKPIGQSRAVPAFAAGQRNGEEAMAARIGPTEAGFPTAAVWLFVLGVVLAAAVVLSPMYWA